jgi:serine phosphatase RsbU (regulator of sigma subunit)
MVAKRLATHGPFETNVTIWSSSADGALAGGDWCDVISISEEAIAFTVGDVAGHGADVAETMAAIRAAVVQAMTDIHDPAQVLALANDVACRHQDGGVIVTAIVAFLDTRFQTLTFANAGHPPPLMLSGDGHAYLENPPSDLPLGIFSEHHAANYVVAIPTDALVVFYTDGITEHERDPIRGEAQLSAAARHVYEWPEFDDARAIAQAVLHVCRGDDDAAAMVLRTTPA